MSTTLSTSPNTSLTHFTFDSGLPPRWRVGGLGWKVHQEATPSPGTGPASGHGGVGSYIYADMSDAEMSPPRKEGEVSTLQYDDPCEAPLLFVTVEWFFHMTGGHVGTLRVRTVTGVIFIRSRTTQSHKMSSLLRQAPCGRRAGTKVTGGSLLQQQWARPPN